MIVNERESAAMAWAHGRLFVCTRLAVDVTGARLLMRRCESTAVEWRQQSHWAEEKCG